MSLDSLKTDDSIQEEKDSVGGSTFTIDSGLHNLTIDAAFIGKADSGAMSLTLHLKNDVAFVRQTLWITSGKAKGNRNYYMVKKDGKETGEKAYLPGFNVANALCLLTIGKEISEITTEEKIINLYDFDAGKEIPKKVDMILSLLDQETTFGIVKQIVDKKKKDDNGVYQPTGETREENEIKKVFRLRDGLTITEIKARSKLSPDELKVVEAQPTFKENWGEKNTGTCEDKSTKTGTTAGSPGAATTQAKPTESIFT